MMRSGLDILEKDLGNVTIEIPTNSNLRYVVNGGDGDNDGHNTDP